MAEAYSPTATYDQLLAWTNQEDANRAAIDGAGTAFTEYSAIVGRVGPNLTRLIEALVDRAKSSSLAAQSVATELQQDLLPVKQMMDALAAVTTGDHRLSDLTLDIATSATKVREIDAKRRPRMQDIPDKEGVFQQEQPPELTEEEAAQQARHYTNPLMLHYSQVTPALHDIATVQWRGPQGKAPTAPPDGVQPPGAKSPGGSAKAPGSQAAKTPGGADPKTPAGSTGSQDQNASSAGSPSDSADSAQSPAADPSLAGTQTPTQSPPQLPTDPSDPNNPTSPSGPINTPPTVQTPIVQQQNPPSNLKFTDPKLDEPKVNEPEYSDPKTSSPLLANSSGPKLDEPESDTSRPSGGTKSPSTTPGGTVQSSQAPAGSSSGAPKLAGGVAADEPALPNARGGYPYMPPMGGMGQGQAKAATGIKPGAAEGVGGPDPYGRPNPEREYAGVPQELRGRSADRSATPRRRKGKGVTARPDEILDEHLWSK